MVVSFVINVVFHVFLEFLIDNKQGIFIINILSICWEQCFQSIQSVFAPEELKAYEVEAARFLDIGTYARYLKNTESVNGTAILLDYTFSKWHDPKINFMLQPHENVSQFHFWKT